MSNYTEKDTNPMSWEEMNGLVDVLIEKINKYFNKQNQKVDVISQLHRTGGIVGSLLAIKMGVIPLLPVQFKYSHNPTKINQIISVPDILVGIPENMNIILGIDEKEGLIWSICRRRTEELKWNKKLF